jgi:hypothetical protein
VLMGRLGHAVLGRRQRAVYCVSSDHTFKSRGAWPNGLEVKPKHGPDQASYRHTTQQTSYRAVREPG